MKRMSLITSAVVAAAGLCAAALALAQNTPQQPARGYGSALMTAQERAEHQQQMRTLQTAEERAQYRAAHHAQMQARAQERGVTLPAVPPAQGQGAGPCARQAAGGMRGCPAR